MKVYVVSVNFSGQPQDWEVKAVYANADKAEAYATEIIINSRRWEFRKEKLEQELEELRLYWGTEMVQIDEFTMEK